jgi:prepilin-type N-terminal cleavage/methylation domain-containing protein/prepilin-type processing-associated H-X9-DG protein
MVDKRKKLLHLAKSQNGYFLAKQARKFGYTTGSHSYYLDHGKWLKVDIGLYRFPGFPDDMASEFTRWCLWSRNRQNVIQAIVSYESALFFYNLTDVRPAKIHLVTPIIFRKEARGDIVLHKAILADFEALDYTENESFRITTPLQSLRLMAKSDKGLFNLGEIARKGLSMGLFSRNEMNDISIEPGITGSRQDVNTAENSGIICEDQGGVSREALQLEVPVIGGKLYENSLLAAEPKGIEKGESMFPCRNNGQIAYRKGMSGFTLVELLMAIALISILSAMLLPVLGKARQMAKQMSCANNQRQIGVYYLLYINDNSGWYPNYKWNDAINSYLPGQSIGGGCKWEPALCPNTPLTMPVSPFEGSILRLHYAYTGVYFDTTSFFGAYGYPSYRIRSTQIKKPSTKIMLLEFWLPPNASGIYWGSNSLSMLCRRVHQNGANTLYADNHVGFLNLFPGEQWEYVNIVTEGIIESDQLRPKL